jgi:Fe-S-cluster containining protein
VEKISQKIVNSCKSCTARCCRGLAVVLTIPEALRLLEATGARPGEILEFNCNVDSRRTPHYPLLVKTPRGVEEWFIIIRRAEHDCIFLNEDLSCKIYSARPYVCKLYPFELDGKSFKKGALCPKRFEREAGTDNDAEELKKDLYSHEVIARKWGIERGANGEMPDIAKFWEYFKS